METQVKRKIAFAMSMGIVTTGMISFSILAINIGFSATFVSLWLRSWIVAYVLVIPAILMIGPVLQAKIDQWIS